MFIKRLCLANGDEHEGIEIPHDAKELGRIISEGGFVAITIGNGQEVWLNTEFIIALKMKESGVLNAI